MITNIGLGITGSFCTHEKIIKSIEELVSKGYNILPIISNSVKIYDTRFGKSKDFIEKIEELTKNKVIDNIVTAEPVGPKNLIDILVIAPCTGNTLSKLANAISDGPITMVAKSLMRNFKPIVIGLSTNDALGLNLHNIATLINCKNVFFVPFGQDDFKNKPKSLISKWELIEETIIQADKGLQIQPLLI